LRGRLAGVIGSILNTVSYAGNASTVTGYVIPFRFDSPTWLVVTAIAASGAETVLALGSGYGLAGDGVAASATLRTGTALAATATLRITRSAIPLQDLELENNAPLPAPALEGVLDRLCMAIQDRLGLAGIAGAMATALTSCTMSRTALEGSPISAADVILSGMTGASASGNGLLKYYGTFMNVPLWISNGDMVRNVYSPPYAVIGYDSGDHKWGISYSGSGASGSQIYLSASTGDAMTPVTTYAAPSIGTGTATVVSATATPATFLGQRCIVGGVDEYVCVCVSPVLWKKTTL
jgi:hypothetical protein